MTRARNSANLASHGNLFVDITNDRTGIGSVVPGQSLHVAGTAGFHADVTFTGDNYNTTWDRSANTLRFNDSALLRFGTGNDANIRHDGSNTWIQNNTGYLYVDGNGDGIRLISHAHWQAGAMAAFYKDGGVVLYHDASQKFSTTAYGTNITGTTDTDGLIVSGVATVTTMNVTGVLTYDDVTSVDSVGIITAREGVVIPSSNKKLAIGPSGNLELMYSSTHGSQINTADAGDIRFRQNSSTRARVYSAGFEVVGKILTDTVLEHRGDSDTSIGFSAADTIDLKTGGTQGVRLTSAQKLLVGDHTVSRSIGHSEHILQTEGTNAGENGISLYAFNNNQHAAHFSFGKSRANSTVADDDFLGHILWCAHDGTDANSTAARITAAIDGTPGSNDTPGRLMFYTTADGSQDVTERLRITSGGSVNIGGDYSQTSSKLKVTGTVTVDGGFALSAGSFTAPGGFSINSGNVIIHQYIAHDADSDTKFGFPDVDKFRIELGGVTPAFSGLKSTSGAAHAKWGINVATPQAALHIDEAYNHQGVLRITNGNQGAGYYHQLEMSGTQNIFALWKHYDGSNYYNTYAYGSTGHRWYISGNEKVRIDSSGRLLIGHTSVTTISAHTPRVQIQGTDFSSQTLSVVSNTADANPAYLFLSKQRSGAVGGNTIVNNNDRIGEIRFNGHDGTDFASETAIIASEVDGAPGADDMPGRLVFLTTADGANSPTERLRIDSAGRLLIGTTTYVHSQDVLTVYDDSNSLISVKSGGSGGSGAYAQISFKVASEAVSWIWKGGASQQSVYGGAHAWNFYHGSNSPILIHTNNGSSTAERIRIDSNGRVSIASGAYGGGGTTPELYVRGTSGRQMKIHNPNAGTCSLQMTNSTTGQGEDAGPQLFTQGGTGDFHIQNAYATGDIAFGTKPSGGSTTERLRINSSGQLIMTNAATQTFFDFSTTNNSTRGLFSIAGKDSSGNAITIRIGGFGDTSRGEIFTHSNHGLGFATNNASTQMVLGTNGCLSIGKNGSQGKALELYQSSYAALRIQNSSTGTGSSDGILIEAAGSDALFWNYESANIRLATAGTERFRITTGGDVGINNQSPNSRLAVHDTDGHNITLSNSWSGETRIAFTGGSQDATGYHNGSTAGAISVTASAPGGAATGYMSFYTNKGDNLREAMRINKTGHVTKPLLPAFHARPPGYYQLASGPSDTIIGGTWTTSDAESFVQGTLANGNDVWDNSTGVFTVPVDGVYTIHWSAFLKNNTERRDAMIYLNGSSSSNIIARHETQNPGSNAKNKNVTVHVITHLSAGDEIRFGVLSDGTANRLYNNSKPWSYACAALIG